MKLLHEHVTARAHSDPDSIAIVMKGEAFTYGQLERSTNQLARMLRAVGCVKGDRVCLVLPKSIPAIVSILGALKAGCIYVPIDTASPLARVEKIVDSCEPTCILAAGPVTSVVDGLLRQSPPRRPIRVGWMEGGSRGEVPATIHFSAADLNAGSEEPIEAGTRLDDVAHILFTSGSTGKPKGVVITHSNVGNFLDWALPYFGITPADRISGHPPLHFDLSTFDIFGTLAAGAQLHLVPAELSLLAHKLAEFIRDKALTQWFSVPSILSYMASFDVVRFNDFPSLKRLLWCGEVLPTRTLVYWMGRVPHASFTNLYGPTEATIASSFYTVPEVPADESVPIPIGTACRGEKLLVLDNEGRTCTGQIGDLYIQGVGLSAGYWRDPEKTSAAFINIPNEHGGYERSYKSGDLAKVGADGLLRFVGRSDSQIKSRGYRIELGEIEAALNSLDILSEAAVVSIPSEGFDGQSICCAYVPSNVAQLAPAGISSELGRILPRYMIPTLWQAFDALPKNQNGKIDRNLLRKQFQSNQALPASVA